MDKNYRTLASRGSRAISGMSMGGHGAMYLAIRHPETFGTSVCLMGGVDIRPFPNNWEIKKRLGDISTNRENWEEHTVINQAKEIKGRRDQDRTGLWAGRLLSSGKPGFAHATT